MSSLQYNQVNLSINNSYLICESVTVSQSSQQKPIYSFNNNQVFDNIPTTLKNSISLSYTLEPGNEPNYTLLNQIISDTTSPLPAIIGIGNIFITGWLNSYSLQLAPNGLIKSNCSFDIFTPFTGLLGQQNPNDSNLYDLTNSSGIGHYWGANFYSGSNLVSDNKVLQLGYSAQIGISPIYSIGNPYPVQVYISDVTESLTILSEEQFNVVYSGNHLHKNRSDLQFLILSGINSTNSLTISMDKMIQQDMKYDVSIDNIVLFSNTYSRST